MSELLAPCPFCNRDDLLALAMEYAHCMHCGAKGPAATTYEHTETESATAWNHRPIEEALRAEIAELKRRLGE